MPTRLALLRLLLAAALPACWAVGAAAQASDATKVADRRVVADCLALAAERARAAPAGPDEAAEGDAAAQLDRAAKAAAADANGCIGIVSQPCQQQPGGETTSGMIACLRRELAVWDERLNAAYNHRLDQYNTTSERLNVKHRDTFRHMQRAWLAARNARCEIEALAHEGGSAAGPVQLACLLAETGRQANWLERD